MKPCYVFNILLNIIVILISISSIGFGIWLMIQENLNFTIFGVYSVQILAWVIIGSGILLILTTVMGICGMIRLNRICNLFHVGFIGICFILIIVVASLLFTYQKKVHDFVADEVKQTFINKYGFDTPYTSVWDEIQANLKCCGVYNGNDYKSTKWFNKTEDGGRSHGNFPATCCSHYPNGSYVDEAACIKAKPGDGSIYLFGDGCLNKMKDKIVTVTFGIAIALFVMAGILLIVLLSGCVMLYQVTRDVSYGQVV